MIRTSGQVKKYYEILELMLLKYNDEQQKSGSIGVCNRLHEELLGVSFNGIPDIGSVPYFPSMYGYIECADVTSHREGCTEHGGDVLIESFMNQCNSYVRSLYATGHITDKVKMLVLFCYDCNLLLEGVDDYGYVYYQPYDALLDYELLCAIENACLYQHGILDIVLLHHRTVDIGNKDGWLMHDYIEPLKLVYDIMAIKDNHLKVVPADIVFSNTNVEAN